MDKDDKNLNTIIEKVIPSSIVSCDPIATRSQNQNLNWDCERKKEKGLCLDKVARISSIESIRTI
ncbi:hypothetical protein PanWU01x14_321310 [Parasponia andersonii]|uniref:Uncharacterized protein n=1 Tax=Parasponia andersonii TaxID=3476 RepID=A0A2P5AL82_PARAD|nr:hypothetical protein PanWU01x14_321310 [Parasponia andersonii]